MNCSADLQTHHKNSNPLDNRRVNLENLTQEENLVKRNFK